MPEGDNVLRYARILGSEMTGKAVDRLIVQDIGVVPELAGAVVASIEARGKQMLVHLDRGWTLRVHLGMKGGWRRRHVREPAPYNPTVDVVMGDTAYACVGSYRAELIRTHRVDSHPRLGRLGPDLLADPPDIDEAVRLAKKPGNALREIGVVVMDQRIAAGIGNIYKSETLFETRTHPRTKLHQLDEADVRAIYEKAAQLMRMNLLTRARTSVLPRRRTGAGSKTRFFTYMRKNKACVDCGAKIERIVQGDEGRSTYFCPSCQPMKS